MRIIVIRNNQNNIQNAKTNTTTNINNTINTNCNTNTNNGNDSSGEIMGVFLKNNRRVLLNGYRRTRLRPTAALKTQA